MKFISLKSCAAVVIIWVLSGFGWSRILFLTRAALSVLFLAMLRLFYLSFHQCLITILSKSCKSDWSVINLLHIRRFRVIVKFSESTIPLSFLIHRSSRSSSVLSWWCVLHLLNSVWSICPVSLISWVSVTYLVAS